MYTRGRSYVYAWAWLCIRGRSYVYAWAELSIRMGVVMYTRIPGREYIRKAVPLLKADISGAIRFSSCLALPTVKRR
jgi:hypothetical protein